MLMETWFGRGEEENHLLCPSEAEGQSVAAGEPAIPLWRGAFALFPT